MKARPLLRERTMKGDNIPIFWVPVLLVTHVMIFARLIRRTAQRDTQAL